MLKDEHAQLIHKHFAKGWACTAYSHKFCKRMAVKAYSHTFCKSLDRHNLFTYTLLAGGTPKRGVFITSYPFCKTISMDSLFIYGWWSASKFRKAQIRNLHTYKICYFYGPSANVAICGFGICSPILFVTCGFADPVLFAFVMFSKSALNITFLLTNISLKYTEKKNLPNKPAPEFLMVLS